MEPIHQQTLEYVFEIRSSKPSYGGEEAKLAFQRHIRLWKKATSLLSQKEFEHEQGKIVVLVNWLPIIRSHKRYLKLEKAAELALSSNDKEMSLKLGLDMLRFIHTPTRITIKASAIGKNFDERILEYYVTIYLYDVFLIMNLSDSGSCDFGSAALWRANAIPTRFRRALFNKIITKVRASKINASNELFASLVTERNSDNFLSVRKLPLEQTVQWVTHIRKAASVLPQSPFEKVLFSLLHLTGDSSISATSVIWIFYGLETLFATRPGENRKAIEERAAALLGLEQKQAKKLGKDIRDLYEFRSSIVHGGLEIIHVIGESLDNVEEQFLSRLLTLSDFGFALLVACIQELIARRWRSLMFMQILGGETIDADAIATVTPPTSRMTL